MLENCAVTVTVVAGSSSATLDGSADRFMARLVAVAPSVRVRLVPFTVRPAAVPSTPIVSLPSISVSSIGVRVKVPVPLVSPAVIVMSKLETVL